MGSRGKGRRQMLRVLLAATAAGMLSGCVGLGEQGGLLSVHAPRQPLKDIEPVAYRQGLPPRIDSIVVIKHKRLMQLYAGGRVVKEYHVALGKSPVGHKQQQGDNKTPEGLYHIDWRNANSGYHLSMRISYPNEQDVERARERGVNPGSMIMIHGLPNDRPYMVATHRITDWTNGCIAVTNPEIEELWRVVPTGTPIEIRP